MELVLRPGAGAADALRLLWQHRFGAMLIEVQGERVFVNGQPVEPAEAPSASQAPAPSSTRQASS